VIARIVTCGFKVNLVQKAIDFLVLLVDSTATVAAFSKQEKKLVARVIAFLTETMQGPCPRNQVRPVHLLLAVSRAHD
jgi:hypothetical protein